MGATPHDLSAIDAMGSQFKHNVFGKLPGKFLKVAKAARPAGQQTPPKPTMPPRGQTALPSGTPMPSGAPRTARPHGPAPKPALGGNRAVAALPSGGQPTTTYAMSPKRPALPGGSFNRPALTGPAPRVFAMGSGGASVTHVQNRSQFVDVTPKDNSPYPTHQHPEGSSNMKLKNLSASQPRPNDFTVGSRNAKPNGIAAAGSRLEAWAQAKSTAVQARQASRKAGGRDRNLAAEAKKAENFANQPLRNFAP